MQGGLLSKSVGSTLETGTNEGPIPPVQSPVIPVRRGKGEVEGRRAVLPDSPQPWRWDSA